MMKKIYLLGATGSIGRQVLEIIRGRPGFKVESISFNKNLKLGREIIAEFKPEYVAVGEYADMVALKGEFPRVKFGFGEEGLLEAATHGGDDGYLVNAVVGSAGLRPTVAAIKKRRNILLANKETLVVAGEIIMPMVREAGVTLLPIDSEHSGVFQCLKSGKREEISRIILTASGGAFRSLTRAELKDVGVEDALRHPNWRMGAKITVDSATMANKGLEIIEAHHLFGVEYDRIETLLHPESAVHSLVEFRDRSVIAQLSLPDMRIPIQYALFYPERVENEYPELRLEDLNKLHFYKMDYNRYPLLDLAYEVGKAGGIMPAVYNAANEAAVELFLNGRIAFLDIETIVEKAVAEARNVENPTLDTVLRVDREVKSKILNQRWVK